MENRSETAPNHLPERDLIDALVVEVGPTPTQDALLPILHAIQARLGHISKESIRQVAQGLNLSRADVQGVVSFYEDFREAPTACHVIQLCMAEACQAVGCRELAAHAQARLGVGLAEATADGQVEIRSAYCFGNCATGPTIRIDDRIHGRVTPARFDALVAPLREAR